MTRSAVTGPLASSPFFRSELIEIRIVGADPFARLSLFVGTPIPPVPNPDPAVLGSLEIGSDLQAIAGFDGLGVFGPPSALGRTDQNGELRLTFQAPTSCAFTLLDTAKNVQAAILQIPDPTMPNPLPLVLSSADDIELTEPAGSSSIAAISTNGANPRSFVDNVPTDVTLTGSFLPQTVALPVVRVESLLDPAPIPSQASQVSVDPTGTFLTFRAPATLLASGPPPASAFGPVRVIVDYFAAGVSCDPMGGLVTAGVIASCDTPAVSLPPTYLLYESTVTPAVSAISPRGSGIGISGPMVTITGTDFMAGAEVIFTRQSTGQRTVLGSADVTVMSPTTIMVSAPMIAAQGVYDVTVRNPDCHESSTSGATTEFVYFDLQSIMVNAVTVNGGMPSLQEAAGTFTLGIAGTATSELGLSGTNWHPFDAAFGPTTIDLGSDIGPMAFSTVAMASRDTPGMSDPPDAFVFTVAGVSSIPPGNIMPPALSMGGQTNTGLKHVRLTPSAMIDPGQAPHQTFAVLSDPMTTPEPGNAVLFTAANAPVVGGFAPNNCGVVDGGQTVMLTGTDILTNDGGILPSTNGSLGPDIEIFDPLGMVATQAATLDEFAIMGMTVTLTFTTPDFAAAVATAGVTLPYSMSVRVTNPDGQSGVSATSFFLYESLVSSNPADERTATIPGAGMTTIDSTTAPMGAPLVYNYSITPDLTIPAGVTVAAQGDHPLIIRVSGDVEIAGTLDLSGGSVTGGPFGRPSGAGAGAPAEDLMNLGLALAAGGRSGTSTIDAAASDTNMLLTLWPLAEGTGGAHNIGGAGGGGGAMLTMGMVGVDGPAAGPVPGSGGLAGVPFAFMPAGVLPLPPLWPTGMTPGVNSFTEIWNPPGGAGGGAGGLGTPSPFAPGAPPPSTDVGQNGAGGNGGGGVAIICDGVITIRSTGRILANGQDGGAGMLNTLAPPNDFGGGGGGGGAGGGIVLQAIQGIVIEATMVNPASLDVLGGAGGAGAAGPTNSGTAGGAGGDGLIRFAIPVNTAVMGTTLAIAGGAVIQGTQDLTGF